MSIEAKPQEPSPRDTKNFLRSHYRHTRSQRSPRALQAATESLATVLDTIPAVRKATCIAAFASMPTEPGTGIFLDTLTQRGTRILIPVLGAGLSRCWAEYHSQADLAIRAPGRPPEPSGPALDATELRHADAVILPALAVDQWGTRLGHGGGWYDRALLHQRPHTWRIAVVFDDEITTTALPREPHDQLVDAVATPHGWRPLTEKTSRGVDATEHG